MGWRVRKTLKFGPVNINLSKTGIGESIGIRGVRVGLNAKGQKYSQVSIPGTGIYRRDYYKESEPVQGEMQPVDRSGWSLVMGIVVLVAVISAMAHC